MQKLGVCFGILSRITAAHCNQRIHNTNINFFPLPSPPTPLLGFMAVDSDISPRQGRLFNPWLHCTDYTYFSVLYCIVLYLLLYGLHILLCIVLYCIYYYTDYTYLEQIDKEPPPFHRTGHGRYQRNCDFISACHQLYPVRRPDLRGDVRKALEKSVGSWI